MSGSQRLLTLGEIARDEGVPLHRVTYAADTYRIKPTQRAGVIRLYDAAGAAAIRSALRRISSRGDLLQPGGVS